MSEFTSIMDTVEREQRTFWKGSPSPVIKDIVPPETMERMEKNQRIFPDFPRVANKGLIQC